MKRRNVFLYGFALLITDLLALNLGLLFSYWFRFRSGLLFTPLGIPDLSMYIKILPIASAILLFIMRSYGLYAIKARLSIIDEFFLIVKSVSIGFIVLMATTFIYREFTYSRVLLITSWVSLVVFLSASRLGVNRLRLLLRKSKKDATSLLVVGTGSTTQRLIRHISGNPHWNYNICGIVSVDPTKEKELNGIPVLGDLDDISNILSRREIDEVILTIASLPRQKTFDLILECEKRMIDFKLVADLLGMVTSQVDMQNIDGIPLLSLRESPLLEWHNRAIKRIMDIVISGFGMFILAPVFLVISILVKVSSPGPVFYLQKRIGQDKRRFAIFKFRTMKHKAEKGLGPVWARRNDPRRTKIGSFLRRHNLDEIPQLLNVIKGEMSLVGPRPERPKFVGKFKEDIPRYMSRHKVKSGVTGWAQANGLRGDTSIEERTKYDIYYMENWSLFLDLKIIFMSIISVFLPTEGAY